MGFDVRSRYLKKSNNEDYTRLENMDLSIERDKERDKYMRMRAIELAKSGRTNDPGFTMPSDKINDPGFTMAGNDRTTAIKMPQPKLQGNSILPTYSGMNIASNGADVDQSKFKTEAATQKGWKGLIGTKSQEQTISKEQSLAHANEVYAPYKDNQEVTDLLKQYVSTNDDLENLRMHGASADQKYHYVREKQKLEKEIRNITGLSKDDFNQIAENYTYLRHDEERKAQQEKLDSASGVEKAALTGLNVATSAIGNYQSAVGLLKKPNDPELGRDYNSVTSYWSNLSRDTKEAVHTDIDESTMADYQKALAGFGYDAFTMGAESAASQLLGGAGLASFFAGGYASSLEEAEQRGLTKGQAQGYALVAGGLEYATEKLPWDNLKAIYSGKALGKDAVKGSLMPYVTALLKQAGEEAGEEVINGLGDVLADALINSDKSKINIAIDNYMAQGLSEEEATRKAFLEEGKDILYAAASAAVSAGASAGPALTVQAYETTKAGRNLANYENETGNLTRNVENEAYIPDSKESYVADEDYEQAQKTRQAILAASEKAAKNERISGREARALTESYSQTAENLRIAKRVEGTKLIEGAKARAEEKAVEDIKKASTAAEVETIKEEHINSEAVKAAVEEKKAEMIEAGEATEAEFTEAITPTKAAAMAESGDTIAPEVLENLPKKVQQAYETGSATQANKLTSDVTKTDINTIELTDESGKKSYADIKSVSQNSNGEIVFELSNGKSVKAAEAGYTPKGKYLYNSPNGINSLDNPVLVQTAINIEQNSKHGVPVGSVTLALKDMYTMGAAGLDFEQAIKSRDFDIKTLGKENLRTAYEEGKKNSTATSRATYAKKGSGLIKESSADNDQAYKNQFVKRVKKNGKTAYEYDAAAQSEYESQLDESSKNFLELFSKKLGVDIAFFSENSSDRGFYEPSEGTIYLNLNHSHNMFNVALHEGIGEFMAASNEKAYNAIVDSVLNAYAATNSTKLAKDIRAYQAAYEGDTYGGTYRGAAQELFNDALSDMFSSEENMQKLFDWMVANEGEKQAQKVKKTLVDYLKSVKDTIHDVLTGGLTSTIEERKLKLSEKEASTYVDRILKAMDQAIANRDAGVVQQGEGAPRNSKKIEVVVDNNGIVILSDNMFSVKEVNKHFSKVKKELFNYLVQLAGNNYTIKTDNRVVYIDTDLADEFTGSDDTWKNKNNKYRRRKSNAAFGIEEMIKNAVNPQWLPNKEPKHNIDAARGWSYYDVNFGIKGDGTITYYTGLLVIRMDADGKDYVYDLTKVKNKNVSPTRSGNKRNVLVNSSLSSSTDNATPKPAPKSINVEKLEETARHSFAGIGAETADMHQLNIASDMMDEGIDEETILASTGWFKGLDNKWKFEIPDNDLVIFKEGHAKFLYGNPDFKRYNELMDKIFFKGDAYTEEEYEELGELEEKVFLKTQEYGNLSDFIKHDKLFEAYPFLYGTYVDFVDFGDASIKGAADIHNNGIHLNEEFHKSVSGSYSSDAMKSTLLHEIQHLIQQFESFANGASPTWWNDIKQERIAEDEKTLVAAKEYLNRAVEDAKKRNLPTSAEDYIYELAEQLDREEITLAEYKKEIAKFKKSKVYHYTDMTRKLERHIRRLKNDSNELLYWNTAGEIEARDVQNRMSLTEQERREKLPKNYDSDVVYTDGSTAQRRYSIKVDTEGRSLSEAQQNYFKDSKVVDEEGRLRVVYHGTMADFTIFDLKEARDTEDIEAFFFSGDYEESGGYGNVGEYYLNITNPADYKTAYDIFFKYRGKEHAGRLAREELQSLGYDGVIAVDEDSPEYTEYLAFSSNQIKRVSNLNPTKNDDVRKSIKVDNQGRDIAPGMAEYLKDNDEVFFDNNGAVKNYYHGTRYAGFTQFSLSMMDDKQSIFLTDSKGTANTYAGNHDLFEPDKEWTYNQLENAISYMTGGDWEVNKDGNTITITEYGFGDEEDKETQFDSILAAQTYFIDNFLNKIDLRSDENAAIYNVYVKSSNPYVVEADGNTWDEIFPSDYAKHYTDVNITETDGTYQVDYQDGKNFYNDVFDSKDALKAKFGEIFEDFENSTVYIENLYLDKNNNRIPTNTRQFAKLAKQQGYDSLVVNNVVDTGIFGNNEEKLTPSQIVVVFNPNQVKSVYNPNPTESEDIRYSKAVNSDGNKLSVQQEEMFKNSKAVDKRGNLLVLYHGSQSEEKFNTFDMNAKGAVNGRAFGDGYYFTPYKDVAEFWGDNNLYSVYLNLEHPYYANKSSKVPKDVRKLIVSRLEKSFAENSNKSFYSNKLLAMTDYSNEVHNAYDALEVLWNYGMINEIKSLGYDGVIFDDKDVQKYSVQYVAFNPEQIKETTNINPTKESKDIRYSISVGEDRIHTYKGIEIVQNPTNKEYQQMRADIIKERPWMDGPDTILLRHTYDEEGNEYYWDAYAGMHFEIEPIIASHWNTRVNQQWEWWKDNDKDFWANRSFRRYSKAVFGEESQYSSQLEQTQFVSQILSTLNNQLKGTTVSMKYLDDTVKYILDKYDADLNPDDFKMELSQFIAYMTANEQVDYNQMMNYLLNVGDEVIQASNLKDPEEERIYSELKKELSSHKINLTDVERKELISKYGGSWNVVFGKLNAAGIKLNNAGQHMDGSTYSEIVDKFREIAGVQLDEETTAVDQIATILDAMDALKPSAYQWEGATDMDKALDVATTIIDRYYSMATAIKEANIVKGTEKGAAAVERAKKNEIKKLRAKQEEYKAKVNQEFMQLVEDRKKVIQEQQEFYKRQAEIEKNFRCEKREFNKKANLSQKELEKTARLQAQVAYKGLKETEAKKKNKDNIVRTCMRLINWMNKPTDTRHVPTFLKPALTDMIKSINFMPASMRKGDDGTITAIKWQESMRKLQQVIKSINAADVESISDADRVQLALVMDVEDITAKMEQLLNKYGGTADISRMKAEDLKTLSDIMSTISKGISQMNENFMNRRYKHVGELAEASISEMQELKPISDTTTVFKDKAADFLNLDMLEPISFFEELGDASASVMQEFFDGEKTGIEIIREAEDFFDDLAKELNVSKAELRAWSNDSKSYNIDGGVITLSSADIMSLYCSYKREMLDQEERPFEATHHIAAGGIKGFKNTYKKGKGIKKYVVNRNARALHANQGTILELINSLDVKQQAYADRVVDYMSTTLAAHGNETSNKMNGYSKYLGKYYFPLKTENNAIATTESNSQTGLAGMLSIVHQSFTKSQLDKADNALVVMDFFDVVTEHITGMANYCAYSMPLSDALRWFNYASTERNNTENENEYLRDTVSIKGSMDRVKGKNARTYFENFLRAVNLDPARTGGSAIVQNLARTLTGLGRAKAVALNGSVWVQQPTAITRAADVIEDKYLAQGWAKMSANPKAATEYAQKESYLCYWKNKGFSDYRVTVGMKEIITGYETKLQELQEFAGAPAGLLDDTTWAAMYFAAEYKIKETTDLQKGTEEFHAAVEELFSDIINHTQVIDSNLRTTQTMKGRNDFEYLANAFKKEPQKTYNMLHRAGWEYYQYGTPEAKKKCFKALRVFIVSAIVNALFRTPFLVIRDDEDEEFIKKYLKKLLPYESYEAIKKQFEKPINEWTYKDIIPLVRSVWGGKGAIGDNLDVFSSMPLVAEIDSWFQGFSPSTLSYTSILTEANKTVNSLSSATATPYNLLYAVASFSDYVTGLGISNLMKDFRGFWNQTTRVTGLPRIEKSTANEAKAAKTKQINALKDALDSAAAANTSEDKMKAKTDIDAAVNSIYQEKYDLYINDKEKPKTEAEADKDAKEQTASTITRNFKPIYKELVSNGELNEATNLMNNLIYAYSKVGYKKTKSDFDEWLKE